MCNGLFVTCCMAALDQLYVPSSAARLVSNSNDIQPVPRIRATLPSPTEESVLISNAALEPPPTPLSPFNPLPNIMLSSVLHSSPQADPRGKISLLSTREPLSMAATTVNFKSFVSRVGPVFWLQDRVEEIILWKKGWKWTTIWLLLYCILCYYPRLLFCTPQFILISVILSTKSSSDDVPPGTTQSSQEWANVQGIQNLMGFYSEAYDALMPILSHFTHKSTFTPHIFTLLVVSLLPTAMIVSMPYFPVRQVLIAIGVLPLIVLHPALQPMVQRVLKYLGSPEFLSQVLELSRRASTTWLPWRKPPSTAGPQRQVRSWRSYIQSSVDNDNLTDAAWNAEMRQVELFENERLDPSVSPHDTAAILGKKGFRKAHLRPSERGPWTKRRDGWGNVSSVSSSTFSLAEHWSFVETEDWRPDVDGTWSSCGSDANGWVYTNDSWLEARPSPQTEYGLAVTRRRRWVRRLWHNPET